MLKVVVLAVMGIFIGISQSAGIGGGPILNICLMIGLGYDPKMAMAMTYIFLMGGSLASIFQTYSKKRKDGFPLIDYELIELTLPMCLSGSLFGVMFNHYMSDLIITILFSVLLGYLSFNSYQKYQASVTQNQEAAEPLVSDIPLQTFNADPVDATSHPIVQSILENQKATFPKEKIKVMVYAVLTTLILSLLRGSISFNSIIGVSPCGVVFWVFNILHMALCYLFAKSSAIRILRIQGEKQKFGIEIPSSEKMTATKFRSAMFYGFIAGIVGGALGLGGAIILVPVWLGNGIDKQIATSSSPPLIFMFSIVPMFLSAVSGSYNLFDFACYFGLSFFSSMFIKWIIVYITTKYKLKSMVYILLLLTMVISLIGLLPYQYYKYTQDPVGFMETGYFC